MAPSIRLDGWPTYTDIAPGLRHRLGLSITNTGQIVDQYVLSLTGLDESWYTLTPPTVSLFPGATGHAELLLHPPPGSASAGDYPFTVAATSATDPAFQAARESGIRISKVGNPAIDLRPLRVEGRRAAFTVKWKNPTNSPYSVLLAVRDAEDGLRTMIDPEGPVPVPPGQERSVRVSVWPKRGETVGPPHPYDIEFRGLRPGSEDLLEPALKRSSQFIYLPPMRALALPRWLRRLPIWALLALLLFLLALLFLAGRGTGNVIAGSNPSNVPRSATAALSPTQARATQIPTPKPTQIPPPTIESFGIQVGPKGGASIAWRIKGALKVDLGGRVVGQSGQQAITVTAPRTLVLTASNGGSTVVRFLRVVPPPVRTLSLVAPPQRIGSPEIRQFSVHVNPHTGIPTLAWQVLGADARLLNKKAVAPKGSETLMPAGPRKYVLQARNAAGITTSMLSLPPDPRAQSGASVLQLPSIATFTLQHLHAGQPYVLVWRVTNAVSARLNGAAVPFSGRHVLRPPLASSRYTLIARNPNGQIVSSVRILVT